MAAFRTTTHLLTGMCKASIRSSCLFNTPIRMYTGLARHSLQTPSSSTTKLLLSSSSRQFARPLFPTTTLPNGVSSLENAIALCPLTPHPLTKTSRQFHTTSSRNDNDNDHNTKKPTFGEQMSLRLINENGFLSWTRNSYLSAAVGATMLNGANVDVVQHAGILVLVVSAMNMAWGSACHLTNLIRIRDRCAMSRPTLLLNLLGCVIHAFLWLFILGYYIHFSGYTGWVRHRRQQRRQQMAAASSAMAGKEQ